MPNISKEDIARAKEWLQGIVDDGDVEECKIALEIISAYEQQEKQLAELRELLRWAIKAGDLENIAWGGVGEKQFKIAQQVLGEK